MVIRGLLNGYEHSVLYLKTDLVCSFHYAAVVKEKVGNINALLFYYLFIINNNYFYATYKDLFKCAST